MLLITEFIITKMREMIAIKNINSKKRHLVTAITKCHQYHDLIDQVTLILYHGISKKGTHKNWVYKKYIESEDIS